jgi:zinc protease
VARAWPAAPAPRPAWCKPTSPAPTAPPCCRCSPKSSSNQASTNVELNKLRERKVNGLKQAKEAPRNVVNNYYRSHAVRRQPVCDSGQRHRQQRGALKQADVQRYYRHYYRPDNAAVIVVGDFQAAEMRQQIESLFGAWKASGPALPQQHNGKVQASKARVWLVNKPDAIETTFLIGGAGIARNDPDYVPLQCSTPSSAAVSPHG